MNEGELPGTVGVQLDRFLDDKTIAGRSALTVRMYRFKLRARLPLDAPVHELTREVCRELVAREVRMRKPGTAHTFHAILGSFTAWLESEGLLPANPMARVPKPRLPEPVTKALSQEALARLWQAACELDRGADMAQPPREAGDYVPKSGSDPSWSLIRRSGASICSPISTKADSTTQAACELDSEAAREGGSESSSQRRSTYILGNEAGSHVSSRESANAVRAPSSHDQSFPVKPTYRLLFLLLATTGMRRAEVAGARWDDIEGDVLRVLGKGRKWRRVLLTPEVLGLLYGASQEPLAETSGSELEREQVVGPEGDRMTGPPPEPFRHPVPLSGDHVVIHRPILETAKPPCQSGGSASLPSALHCPDPTTHGPIFGVSPSRIGQLFAQIARRAGVKATPHSLRHTWATEFLRKGGQMEAARILGGWADMRMLSSRYARSSIEEAALMEARRLITNAAP